jgi:hypothetical protein
MDMSRNLLTNKAGQNPTLGETTRQTGNFADRSITGWFRLRASLGMDHKFHFHPYCFGHNLNDKINR